MSETGRCRSCGAAVIWTVTATGKRMPVDAAPSTDGNVFVFTPGSPEQPFESESISSRSSRVAEAIRIGWKRYTSHFATCPDAAKHRRTR